MGLDVDSEVRPGAREDSHTLAPEWMEVVMASVGRLGWGQLGVGHRCSR